MSGAGVCKVKSEFILPQHSRELNLQNVSETDKRKHETGDDSSTVHEPQEKKAKLKGQNKARKHTHQTDRSNEACNSLMSTVNGKKQECRKPKCRYIHDIDEYMRVKAVDLGNYCYNYEALGFCHRGITCRFSKCHINAEGFNMVDEDKKAKIYDIERTLNVAKLDLLFQLRRKKYDFHLSEKLVKFNDALRPNPNKNSNEGEIKVEAKAEKNGDEVCDEVKVEVEETKATSGVVTDEDIIKLLQREKKTIDFKDKLYLSPLTTVGNLPFRRICKEYGADITCGEMAMAKSLLQGTTPEWALVKRHHTEDLFGVQICGSNPHILTKCAQLLDQEIKADFVDLNLGCPIELVYREGGGCGLLRRTRLLELCVRNLSQILEIPLTVKTRTGVYSKDPVAHTLVPKFRDWGAAMLTIHGRSREQRYTRNADWEYVEKCALEAGSMPVFGNGDILSYDDYIQARQVASHVSGVMIGRGALIKPWLFTEIKEGRVWDISSSERLDVIKKYTHYGLEHWGSDTKGVENTRRFLLEWLSFLYRYVPVGLLETLPQRINERPPCYKGRNDLETLMASSAASDWVKISEMLLGPVPDGFKFLPKHKANSYQ